VIPALVYALCALTSVACALLLLRNYKRRRTKLLLWSSIAFAGLALNNVLLFVDLVVVPSASLAVLRTVLALAAILVLLYGLVWESVA
jgi:hypothetical protein